MPSLDNINITSLVGALERHHPSALEQIRMNFPDAAVLLAPGKILGEGVDIDNAAALECLAIEALKVGRERAEITARKLELELSRARKMRVISNFTGGGSAAGVVGAVALGQYWATLLASLIVFASSVLALTAEYFEGTFGGVENRHVLRNRLRELSATAHMLDAELKLLKLTTGPEQKYLEIVRQANVTVADIRRIEFDLGLH